MSVYTSQRTISKVQFVATAQELMEYTLIQTNKFPKSYRFNLVNSLYNLSFEIFDNVVRANSIYVHKNMTDIEFNERKLYLTKARAALFSLSAMMTTVYNLLRKGNNFLGDGDKTTNIFMEWAKIINTEAKLINSVMKSDMRRYADWNKKEIEDNNKEEKSLLDENDFT